MKKEPKKVVAKPKRARTAKGHFKADDKSTPHINEAYEQPKNNFKTLVWFLIIVGILFSFSL